MDQHNLPRPAKKSGRNGREGTLWWRLRRRRLLVALVLAAVSVAGIAWFLDYVRPPFTKLPGVIALRQLGVEVIGHDAEVTFVATEEAWMDDSAFRYLEGFDSLESLIVNGPITGAGFKYLTSPRLQVLDVGGAKVDPSNLRYLARLSGLKAITLRRSPITGDGLRHLVQLRSLTRLDLAATALVDCDLTWLGRLSGLHFLDISETKITDAGLANLAGLHELVELELSGTKVTDAGLAQLEHFEHLDDLGLSSTQISGSGLHYVKKLKWLRTLSISDTAVTLAEAEAFHKERPDIEVLLKDVIIERTRRE